jgi:uncharacterized membrane protein YbhN (UPF0104 family)
MARLAINVRFFQRQGVPPAVAVTSGAIDAVANTVVQAVLLILLLLFSQATLSLQLSTPSTAGIKHLVVLVVVALIVAVAVFALVPRLRALVLEKVHYWWPQVRSAVISLRRSNKLAMLVLGNVATEILFATALGLFARGLGFHVSLASLLVINTSVSLFASLIPVPGGIGVVEGGLMVGLTAAGLPESSALATALIYRMSTFYIPPIWGWFALRWLQRNRYL